MTRLNKRPIREKEAVARQVINCPLGHSDDYFCHLRCPMRSQDQCVYKIMETPILCEKVMDDETGEGGYVWSFACVHCGHDVVFLTPDETLVGSLGFCLACKARYLYQHPVMAYRTFTVCLMVSRPYCKVVRKKGKK